jgi:hypothetical protein
MKRVLVWILLINFNVAIAGELPRQMLFVNLPDLAQQKLSVSFLNRTKQNNYWQCDAAFRQILRIVIILEGMDLVNLMVSKHFLLRGVFMFLQVWVTNSSGQQMQLNPK